MPLEKLSTHLMNVLNAFACHDARRRDLVRKSVPHVLCFRSLHRASPFCRNSGSVIAHAAASARADAGFVSSTGCMAAVRGQSRSIFCNIHVRMLVTYAREFGRMSEACRELFRNDFSCRAPQVFRNRKTRKRTPQ